MVLLCRKAIFLLLTAFAVSCGSDPINSDINDVTTPIEVVVPVSGGDVSATRTALLEGGKDVAWVIGDEVSLWADGKSSSASALVGETFKLKYFGTSYSQAEFAATLTQEMTPQQYTYRGFYPAQSGVNGKVVSFEIPTVQSGAYDGVADFRVADPVDGRELTKSTLGGCEALSFRSIMHALKITIPEGRNNLSDNKIKQLYVTLPVSAAGAMLYDMSTMPAEATMVDGKSTIRIDLSEENQLSAGDGKYAWLFINPMTLSAGDKITIAAVDTAGKMSADYEMVMPEDREFAVAHITPVNITVPKETTITTFEIKVGDNRVNDVIKEVVISSSISFLEGGTSLTIPVSDEENDVVRFSFDTSLNTLADIKLTFNSDYTTTSYTFAKGNIAANVVNAQSYDIPELLFEDFSELKVSKEVDSNLPVSAKDYDLCVGTKVTLNNTTYGLTNAWTGIHIGTSKENKSIRVTGREDYDDGYIKQVGYLLSPKLSRLRKSAKIKVTYNYSGNESESGADYKQWPWSSTKKPNYGYPIYSLYKVDGSTVSAQISNANYGSTSKVKDNGLTGSYSNIKMNGSKEISGATSSTQLRWDSTCVKDGSDAYQDGNYWLYLDNIKVVIAD